jgi:hypothetical protein
MVAAPGGRVQARQHAAGHGPCAGRGVVITRHRESPPSPASKPRGGAGWRGAARLGGVPRQVCASAFGKRGSCFLGGVGGHRGMQEVVHGEMPSAVRFSRQRQPDWKSSGLHDAA